MRSSHTVWRLLWLLVGVGLILTSCKRVDPEATGVRVEVVHVTREGGKLVSDEGAISGAIWENFKVGTFTHSDRVPLILGHGLGVAFHLNGDYRSLKAVRLKVTYPVMHSPQKGALPGTIDRMQDAYDYEGQRVVDFSYFFDEPWELVEGKWQVEIWHEAQKLAEAQVATYRPKIP